GVRPAGRRAARVAGTRARFPGRIGGDHRIAAAHVRGPGPAGARDPSGGGRGRARAPGGGAGRTGEARRRGEGSAHRPVAARRAGRGAGRRGGFFGARPGPRSRAVIGRSGGERNQGTSAAAPITAPARKEERTSFASARGWGWTRTWRGTRSASERNSSASRRV